MDTTLRKIANPTPAIAVEAMSSIPKTADFIEL
jgi:acyl-CoA thioester hydrolase